MKSIAGRLWQSILLATALAVASLGATSVHAAAGDVDTTFGGGKVLTDFGGFGNGRIDRLSAVAVDTQGRIVAVGSSQSSDFALGTVVALARYNSNGTLDTTFGSNGKVTSGFGFPIGANSEATAVAIDRDGRILVAGWTDGIANLCTNPPCDLNERFLIARYEVNGSLDTAFSGSGIATVSVGDLDRATAIGIDSVGRIVVGGITFGPPGYFEVVRLSPDGFEDYSFGDHGIVVTPLGDDVFNVSSLAIDTQDRVVVAGEILEDNQILFGLVRYKTDGSLDPSFDHDGIVFTDVAGQFVNEVCCVAIDQQGRVLAAGVSFDSNLGPFELALVRYNDDGSLDTSFGSGFGKVLSDTLSHGANALVIDHLGRIVVAGGDPLARFNPDGSVDGSFGNSGVARATLPGGALAGLTALAIDDVGRVVAGGISYNIGTDSLDFTLIRYLSDDFAFSSVPTVYMAVNTKSIQTLIVNSLSKFDSTVNLFASGQPIDVAATLSPASVTPQAGGAASADLSIQLGPSVTPGSFVLTVTGSAPAVQHSIPVNVYVYATSASIANVVGTMQTAGCIDKGIGGAMTSTLTAMQADVDAGRIDAARNTRSALLKQISAQSGKMIATSCTIDEVTVNPVAVLTTDLQLIQGL